MCLRLRFSREAGTALLDLLVGISLVLMVTMMNDHVSSWHISLSLSLSCAGPSGGSRLAEASSTISHTKSQGGRAGGTVPLN